MSRVPTLYDYQREGALWLSRRRVADLFDRPGVGKTPQAICAIPKGAAVVVVCPSGVKLNWRREFKVWRPGFRVRVVKGPRQFYWPSPGNVVITNYESLPPAHRELMILRSRYARLAKGDRDSSKIAALARRIRRVEAIRRKVATRAFPGTVLIGDELHRVKNPEAWATMRFRELAAVALTRNGRVWGLTGTPLVNSRDELWTVLQANGLGTDAFGSREVFDRDWRTPGAVAEKLRAVSLCRRREDVLPHLPPKTREVRLVPIGAALREGLDSLVVALRARGLRLATATLEEIRLATHSTDFHAHVAKLRVALAVAKVPAMLEYAIEREEEGVPLVVVCSHRKPIDLLARRRGWAPITGDESDAAKEASKLAFQRGDAIGVAMTYRAGGVGVNLTRAWNMLHVDLPWTAADLTQAEDRLCRPGQRAAGLLYTRLVADHPLERRVEELLAEKQRLDDESIGLLSMPPAPQVVPEDDAPPGGGA